MSRSNIGSEKKLGAGRVVAVAIENNKTSQHAAKWAVENLLPKDQCLYLIHVKLRTSNASVPCNFYFYFIPSTISLLLPIHIIHLFNLSIMQRVTMGMATKPSLMANPKIFLIHFVFSAIEKM